MALNRWRLLLAGWRPSENAILLALAVSVGLATGGGVWLFRQGIDFFQRTFREGLLSEIGSAVGPFGIVIVLALAGLIVGLCMERFIGEERHHGVAGIMEASALAGGRLRYRRMPVKAALSSFSLGAGASVGPEDPSVQIGANIGSALGQWLHLTDERVKLLVAAGAASGIAAAFRAPIAGVFFALEVILGDFSTSAFGVVVLSAVVAAVAVRAIEAGSPVFSQASEAGGPELGISSYVLGGLQELPLYILLGILLAPVGAVFIRMLYWQQDQWHGIKVPTPIRTMLAGIVVGLIAIFFPQVMGTGREMLNALLNQNAGEYALLFLVALAIAKIIATTVSLGGGFVGGMFAPSLFVGAALGRAFGQFLHGAFPAAFTANPAAFAIAGMAAVMTGVIRAPITAVILLFELTNDYNLILPIMLTTVVCLFLVERLAPDGIYHLGLARKGIRLARGRDIDLLETVTVGETMSKDVQTIPATLPASQIAAAFDKTGTHGLMVVDERGLVYGVLTRSDLQRAIEAGDLDGKTAGDICTRDPIVVTPDMTVSEALKIMSERDLGRIPVVAGRRSPEQTRQLVGLLRRRDFVRAYDLAIQRKTEQLNHFEQVRLITYSGAHVVEARVEPQSAADNHLIREVQWPAGSVVAAIRRHGNLIVPRGDTPLYAGDWLTVVTTPGHEAELWTVVGADRAAQSH